MAECWQLCSLWITWVWQGKVERVIDALDQKIAQTTDAAVLDTLNTSRGYLHNNRDRMRYDEYRRRGLPITTALMESTVKRINRRIQGTEKFWRGRGTPDPTLCRQNWRNAPAGGLLEEESGSPNRQTQIPFLCIYEPCPAPGLGRVVGCHVSTGPSWPLGQRPLQTGC